MRVVDLCRVGIAIWALSWLGVIAAYAASAWGGHLPECIPHLTGCTNVSTSGRYGAGFFIFKATVIPVAVLLALYWVLSERWLRACGDSPLRWSRAMLWVGMIGAAALVLYATFLGADAEYQPHYRTMRRYGTVVYFGFTYLAQLMLVYRARALFGPIPLVRAKLILCVAMLAEGLVLEACTYFIDNDAWLENITEWHVASALTFFPFLTYLLWRRTGFGIAFRAQT
jgi:hypothetical protein